MTKERLARFIAATTPATESWWWLSFCDASRPTGDHLLGVALVRGTCHADAVSRAWRTGCNPGGEAMGIPVPAESGDPPECWRHQLVRDKATIDRLTAEWVGGDCSTIAELEAESR